MKSKLFKILGVVAIVAMLASTLIAVPASAVSALSVTVTSATNKINLVGNYSVYATLATQLTGTTAGTITLPYATDTATFVSVAASDKVALVVTAGTATVTGAGSWSGGTSGNITYSGGAQTETITATVNNTVITYTKTVGNPTLAAGTDITAAPSIAGPGGAISLPDVGDAVKFTDVATTGNVVTLAAPNHAINVAFSAPVGAANYNATTYVITLDAVGQTATVTSAFDHLAIATWTQSIGSPTGVAFTDVSNPIVITKAANGDSITLTFPTGYTIAAPSTSSTFASSSGWAIIPGTTATVYTPAVVTIGTAASGLTCWTANPTSLTITLTLGAGDYIGAQAQILLNLVDGATNPGTQGSYTLNFATSKETTAVTSNAFTISNPTLPVVAGIASVFNSSGVPMTQYNDLASALTYINAGATLPGAVIKLSAGTYNTAFVGSGVSCTIQGTDANAANVILKSIGGWTLSGKTVVIDSVTIDNSTGALTMASTASGATSTISNSFIKGGVLTLSGLKDTLYGDTITVANAAVGVNVTGTAAIVNASTFNVAGTGTGITTAVGTTVTGSTFTGVAATGQTATGLGITVTAGTQSIKTSQFTGLATALTVSGGSTTFDSNTVNSCGYGSTPTTDTIVANAGITALTVTNNKINSSLNYIINVTGCDTAVNVNFNQFSANVKNALNTTGTMYLNVTHNYWGGAAAPANVTTATNQVSYSNPLTQAPGASSIKAGNVLDATATAGVNILGMGVASEVGAVALTSNPVTPTLPSTVTVLKYFDVFGLGATGGTVDIFFSGTTANPVTNSSTVYFYNTINGTWQVAPGIAVNVFANTVEVNFTASATTSPNLTQLAGMPWALVNTAPLAPGAVGTPGAGVAPVPALGATGVGSSITLTWGAVANASYEVILGTDSTFATSYFTASPTTNGAIVNKALAYSTTYYWEVRSVDLTTGLKSAYTTGFFTTMAAPVPVVTPAFGATAVSILPNITWPAVTGAASYNFNLSTDPTFKTVFYTGTSTTNGIAIPKILAWNTTYNWEFQSVDAAGNKSAWTTSFFTTAPQATPTLQPAFGAQNVSVTPTFTWDPIPGAVSYEFALAQEIGAVNKFDILDYSNNTPTPGITAQEAFLYSTTYNWEYRAVDATGAKSAWTVSFFTTMAKPAVVTTTASTPVVTTQPTIIITQPTFTQTPITIISTTGTPTNPAIPSYLLWAVIAVGAVLVIAVIVLIVRTRRIP